MSASRREPALDLLVEEVLSPRRTRDREGRLQPPPAWWDLPPDALDDVFREATAARRLEAALDPQGRSGTVKAVLERIRRG
jgi:hypothetical protein